MSGHKLKLKSSPTKVRFVSLKKIWKQAGRSHERCDVDFAESADFAAFDLHSRTQLNGHSNTYKGGFPLACSMPNFNDVRLREMPKINAKSRKKNRHHIAPRGQGVKDAKFQCQSRVRCAAAISQRESVPTVLCCGQLGLIFRLIASWWQFSLNTLLPAALTLNWAILSPRQQNWCHLIWFFSRFQKKLLVWAICRFWGFDGNWPLGHRLIDSHWFEKIPRWSRWSSDWSVIICFRLWGEEKRDCMSGNGWSPFSWPGRRLQLWNNCFAFRDRQVVLILCWYIYVTVRLYISAGVFSIRSKSTINTKNYWK